MARDFAIRFYHSKRWTDLQKAYAESKNYICERCGKPGRIVHHIHHLTPENIKDPEVTMGWDNLELLCIDCHNAEHMSKDVCSSDCFFDLNGNFIPKKSPRV